MLTIGYEQKNRALCARGEVLIFVYQLLPHAERGDNNGADNGAKVFHFQRDCIVILSFVKSSLTDDYTFRARRKMEGHLEGYCAISTGTFLR